MHAKLTPGAQPAPRHLGTKTCLAHNSPHCPGRRQFQQCPWVKGHAGGCRAGQHTDKRPVATQKKTATRCGFTQGVRVRPRGAMKALGLAGPACDRSDRSCTTMSSLQNPQLTARETTQCHTAGGHVPVHSPGTHTNNHRCTRMLNCPQAHVYPCAWQATVGPGIRQIPALTSNGAGTRCICSCARHAAPPACSWVLVTAAPNAAMCACKCMPRCHHVATLVAACHTRAPRPGQCQAHAPVGTTGPNHKQMPEQVLLARRELGCACITCTSCCMQSAWGAELPALSNSNAPCA